MNNNILIMLQDALSVLPSAHITQDQRNNVENSLVQLIEGNDNQTNENYIPVNTERNFPLPEIPSTNRLILNASDKIRIDFSLEMGRHVLATRDIEPG